MPSGQQVNQITASLEPKGYQQFTAGFAGAQSLSVPAGALVALIQVNGGGIRWRDDGTAPTTGAGIFLSGYNTDNVAREVLQYNGDLNALEFIQDAAAGAPVSVDVSYYAYV